jgi:hypothetical protein
VSIDRGRVGVVVESAMPMGIDRYIRRGDVRSSAAWLLRIPLVRARTPSASWVESLVLRPLGQSVQILPTVYLGSQASENDLSTNSDKTALITYYALSPADAHNDLGLGEGDH